MWGPVLGWCVLSSVAELVDAESPERAALDLFDRLRLRAPFAHALAALGFEGEEAWRVAARIKVLLLTCSGVEEPLAPAPSSAIASSETSEKTPQTAAPKTRQRCDEGVALAPAMWLDPDVRWLTGAHDAEGHTYFIRERYEELLWWLLLPPLLRLAGQAAPDRAKLVELSNSVRAALDAAKAAGYRVDVLLGEDEPCEKTTSDELELSAEDLSEAIDQGATPTEI
jgi:hypothetical protein